MAVLDAGCGPGFFSIELAKMVGGNGTVISADLQDGMLQKLGDKIRGTELEKRIQLVKCDKDSINVSAKVDFVLAFFMVHEIPNKGRFFQGLKSVLNEKGQVLVVEPKLFHVSRPDFDLTAKVAQNAGFRVSQGPRLLLCWSAILEQAVPATKIDG
jgi:ubiquinone/menaquinone biosynthesis C-methylase UbiE